MDYKYKIYALYIKGKHIVSYLRKILLNLKTRSNDRTCKILIILDHRISIDLTAADICIQNRNR